MSAEDVTREQQAALQRFADIRKQEAARSEIIAPASRPLERSAIYICSVALLLTLLVVSIGQLDVIVTGHGKVEPRTQLIPVQSRNTGVVTEVFVAIGDNVEAGALLMRIGADDAEADLASLERRLRLANDERARKQNDAKALSALVRAFDRLRGDDLDLANFGGAVELVQSARIAMLDVDRLSFLAGPDLLRRQEQTEIRIAALEEAIRLRQENNEVLRSEIDVLARSRELREEQLLNIQLLISRGAATRPRELEARDRVIEVENSLNNKQREIVERALQVSADGLLALELRIEIDAEARRRRDELFQAQRLLSSAKAALITRLERQEAEIRATSADIDGMQDELALRRERERLLEIRAPASGTITSLAFASAGSRVIEGEEVVRLLPSGAQSVITVEVPSREVGRLRVGQKAIIKLDAFPYYRFGTVSAEVASVFPKPASRLFVVRLELDEPTIMVAGRPEVISAGLEATVEIMAERRRIASILFDRGVRAFSTPPLEPIDEDAAGPVARFDR